MPTSSNRDPLLTKSEPISDDESTSGITEVLEGAIRFSSSLQDEQSQLFQLFLIGEVFQPMIIFMASSGLISTSLCPS
ncbi:hypothetical protein BTVI_157719 [Pitangus sulphuratus]|nr:hypothetical protein BTVI_157719 [Pitangus sulphuratus]